MLREKGGPTGRWAETRARSEGESDEREDTRARRALRTLGGRGTEMDKGDMGREAEAGTEE